ncbi:MAG: RNA-binding S4 domain-containing protein [Marinifilaceae bacterium]|jgi:ribosome-associated protein|nr:RNA-binding S4 domain-containing protein [Marinifilaceae bacterium]
MIEFEITDEYIELNKLLKVTRVVESGAMAKAVIDDELVIRNGEIETRKRAKIRKGEVIELWDQQIKVI